jgi:hypothetical protein
VDPERGNGEVVHDAVGRGGDERKAYVRALGEPISFGLKVTAWTRTSAAPRIAVDAGPEVPKLIMPGPMPGPIIPGPILGLWDVKILPESAQDVDPGIPPVHAVLHVVAAPWPLFAHPDRVP